MEKKGVVGMKRKLIILVLALVVVLTGTFTGFADQEDVVRLAGENRYQTAVEISKAGWDHSERVVLARGDGLCRCFGGGTFSLRL